MANRGLRPATAASSNARQTTLGIVVGGGRVGTYLACRLRANCKAFDRIVLKRREGDADSLGRVASLSKRLCAAADVEQTFSYQELGQPDVVFLAVKTYDLSAAAAELAAAGMRPRMLVRIRCTGNAKNLELTASVCIHNRKVCIHNGIVEYAGMVAAAVRVVVPQSYDFEEGVGSPMIKVRRGWLAT